MEDWQHSGTNCNQATQHVMNQEEEVLQAAKAWYASHNEPIPLKFRIWERNSNYWGVIGETDGVNEWGLKIDPKTKRVLEAIGD